METHKRCRGCKKVLPLGDFVDCNGLVNPRGHYCGLCREDQHARQEKQWREAIPSATESMIRKFKIIYGEYWEHYASPEYFAGALYLERDFCPYCGIRFPLAFAPRERDSPRQNERVIDHMDPLSKGGEDSIRNAVYVCETCNRKKHAMLFVNWLQKLEAKYQRLARSIYRDKHGHEPEQFTEGVASARDKGGWVELDLSEDELRRAYPTPIVDGPPNNQSIIIRITVSDEFMESMVRKVTDALNRKRKRGEEG